MNTKKIVLEVATERHSKGETCGLKTPEETFIWLVCYDQARQILDVGDTKDVAEMLQGGFPGINTLDAAIEELLSECTTEEEVREMVENLFEDNI